MKTSQKDVSQQKAVTNLFFQAVKSEKSFTLTMVLIMCVKVCDVQYASKSGSMTKIRPNRKCHGAW